jgi:2-polyprenyl-3-methyl-5-hydroxy-6-metoxy-1,4-benzoquinol methylase
MSVIIADVVNKVNKEAVWDKTEQYNNLLMDNYHAVLGLIEKYSPNSKTVLDVGCAYGVLSIVCARLGKDVLAIDNETKYTPRELLKKEGVKFKQWDIEKTEYKQGSFDLIIMTEVLEHLNYNPLKPLKRLAHLLNPGGKLIITTPSYENQGPAPGRWGLLVNWRKIPETGTEWLDEHTHHYSLAELVTLADEAGLETESFGRCYNDMSNYIVARKGT